MLNAFVLNCTIETKIENRDRETIVHFNRRQKKRIFPPKISALFSEFYRNFPDCDCECLLTSDSPSTEFGTCVHNINKTGDVQITETSIKLSGLEQMNESPRAS